MSVRIHALGFIIAIAAADAFAGEHAYASGTSDSHSTMLIEPPYGYIAPIALSTPNVASGNARLFQPWFDFTTWAGDLRAFALNSAGSIANSLTWSASAALDRRASVDPLFWDHDRIVITSDGANRGIPFRFSRLSLDQQSAVLNADVVNFVRGQRQFLSETNPCGTTKPHKEKDDNEDSDSHPNDEGKKQSEANSRSSIGTPYLHLQVASLVVASGDIKNDDKGERENEKKKEHEDDHKKSRTSCTPSETPASRSLLGAIVHSRPVYVGTPREAYPFDGYITQFAQTYANRAPLVYVGSNDGLVHGFNAATGNEVFAYIPTGILGKLPLVAGIASATPAPKPQHEHDTERDEHESGDDKDSKSTPAYNTDNKMSVETAKQDDEHKSDHKEDDRRDKRDDDKHHKKPKPTPSVISAKSLYLVDGQLTSGDVYINGAWRTVLVGGIGAGGQSFFALDITDPTTAANSEEAASKLVLWELSDRNEADIGYTYSRPSLVRLNDNKGTWAVVVGAGYFNETADDNIGSGTAALLVIDIATGRVLKKLTVKNAPFTSEPNGLSSPTVIDGNGDYKADFVYAGDLHGQLWKFDISNPDSQNWRVANNGQPLFSAQNEQAVPQSITAAPTVGFHPLGGFLVYFGTGRLLEQADLNRDQSHSVFALWDNINTPTAIKKLKQSALPETAVTTGNKKLRTLNVATIDWQNFQGWRVDLPQGEQLLTEPLLRAQRLQFTTTNVFSGENWLTELDAMTGGATSDPIFDVNNDGTISNADRIEEANAISVHQGSGLISRPTFGMTSTHQDIVYINRLTSSQQQCIPPTKPAPSLHKPHEKGDHEDDDKKGKSQSSDYNAKSSASMTISSTSHKDKNEREDDNDHEKTKKPSSETDCEQPVLTPPNDHGDDDGKRHSGEREAGDQDSGKYNSKKKEDSHDDDKRPNPPEPVTPPPAPMTTTGTVTRTPQAGNNVPGRKIWHEVTTSTRQP